MKLQYQIHWTCNFHCKISRLINKTEINFRLQEARLEVLKQLLKKREENHAELNIKRLDKLWSKKQKEKDAKVKKIRNEHIKSELIRLPSTRPFLASEIVRKLCYICNKNGMRTHQKNYKNFI